MKLRRRDIGAAIISIFLARIAWNGDAGPDSLSASVSLAFYSELKSFASLQRSRTEEEEKPAMADVLGGKVKGWAKTALPVPLDLDGDGTVEAIVIPSIVRNRTDSSTSDVTPSPQWGLRVLDLKPLHDGKNIASSIDIGLYPFHPRTIFTAGIDGPASKNNAEKEQEEGKSDNTKDAAETVAFPVKMTTGQIHLDSRYFEKDEDKSKSGSDGSSEHDKTRHYFCGSDWHDAANSCKTHCPGGSAAECPDNQRCYADTPCDSEGKSNIASKSFTGEDGEQYKLATTPGGTLPAVVTLWSDGSLTMHALTKDVPIDPQIYKKKKEHRAFLNLFGEGKEDWVRVGPGGLELRLLWKIKPFSTLESKSETGYPEFNEVDVILATDSPIGKHGTVVVGGKYRIVKDVEKGSKIPQIPNVHQSFHAVDAFTGDILWSHGGGVQDAEITNKMNEMEMESQMSSLPTTSILRRRSHIPTSSINEKMGLGGDENDLLETESCLHLFRASVMDPESHTFPHLSWGGSDDTELVVTHFDRKHRGGAGRGGIKQRRKKAGKGRGRAGKNKKSWLKKAIDTALPFSPTRNDGRGSSDKAMKSSFTGKKATPQYGKPNVVLFRHREGISALSLRNGRSVCHLSLIEKSLYGDVNSDGVIDQIQFVSSGAESRMNAPIDTFDFVEELARRVSSEEKDTDFQSKYGSGLSEGRQHPTRLCHAMALSGLPPREEIFGVPLCSPAISSRRKNADRKNPRYPHHSLGEVYAAPPLLVEGSDGGNDIVFATSDGVITRYDAHGQLIWKSHGGTVGLPTWSGNTGRGRSPEYIGRIDYVDSLSSLPAAVVSPHMRPIIVSGEDELVILTSGKGSVLARASFPQTAIERPILTKVSSDGTTDVVVVSTDGMWGYKVTIERGGTGFLRVMVGLFFAGIALAALYNRYGNPPGADVRSTDD